MLVFLVFMILTSACSPEPRFKSGMCIYHNNPHSWDNRLKKISSINKQDYILVDYDKRRGRFTQTGNFDIRYINKNTTRVNCP